MIIKNISIEMSTIIYAFQGGREVFEHLTTVITQSDFKRAKSIVQLHIAMYGKPARSFSVLTEKQKEMYGI
jgi:hypothetical protein